MSSETITRNDLTNILNEIVAIEGTDMTAQEISDFVDSLNVTGINAVDYVVEQGTSGIWTYRKWDSGIAECWGNVSFGTASWSTAGSSYYRNLSSTNFPTDFFTDVPTATATDVMGNVGSCEFLSISKTAFQLCLLSTNNNQRSGIVCVNAIGAWK